MKYIYNQEQLKSINESWFGNIAKWAGGLIKSGKIKKALKQYTQELPVKMKERILMEFEIQVNKKAGQDTGSLEEELKTYQEEEQLIKDELNQSIAEMVKKDPDLKMKAQRLQLETRKALLPQVRQMLEEIAKNDKYEHFKDNIKDRIKMVSQQDQKIGKELNSIVDQKVDKELGLSTGDIFGYKTNDGSKNIIILTGVDKQKNGKIKSVSAKTIQRDGDESPVSIQDFQDAEPYTPNKSGFSKKLDDDDKYDDYKKIIQGVEVPQKDKNQDQKEEDPRKEQANQVQQTEENTPPE